METTVVKDPSGQAILEQPSVQETLLVKTVVRATAVNLKVTGAQRLSREYFAYPNLFR